MSGTSSPKVPRWTAHRRELRAEEDGGVGLAAVGADLECLGGQLFGLIGVPGDLRSQGTRVAVHPVQGRLVELLGERPGDLQAAVHLVDVPGAGGSAGASQSGPEQQDRVTEPLGPNQGVGRPGQRLLEQWRHDERERDVVEDPHDGGVVAGGLGRWRWPRRPAPGDARAGSRR